jgi:predicted esterase
MKKLYFLLFNVLFLFNVAANTIYEKLYIVGNATEAGWNPGAAIELTKSGNGIFTWTGVLADNSKDQARFKFLVAREWHPSLTCRLNVNGHLVMNSAEEYDLYERPTGTEGYDNAFQVNSTGTYSIGVNLNTMKIICTKISDEGKPDLSLFSRETYLTTSGETLLYRKLTPLSVEAGTKYPLVIFLHGAGERGSDNESQLTHGGSLFVTTATRQAFPAYVLFPQCPSQNFWPFETQPNSYQATTFPADYPVSSAIKQVKELIDNYIQMDQIDVDRVYIIGLSMGGMGTFDIACRYPDIFAAAVPMCSGINTDRINNTVKDIHWRIFHGSSDRVVPVQNSRDAYAKLTLLGTNVEYIEYAGVDHNVWDSALRRSDFLSWIFSKTRVRTTGINQSKNSEQVKISSENQCIVIQSDYQARVQLFNLSGQLIIHEDINHKSFRSDRLTAGIYFVKTRIKDSYDTQKIIVQ